MSDFARQQAEFQRGILSDDDTVLAEILDSPREKREALFGVYRYAYGSRLVEAVRNDHELLHLYLGDEMFDEMGHAYVKAHPSEHPNLRWFSKSLPDFLRSNAPYSDHPVLSDLAALEKALNDAFDAAEGAVVELTDDGRLCAGSVVGPQIPAAPQRVQARSCDQRVRDLARAQERRNAAGSGRAGSSLRAF